MGYNTSYNLTLRNEGDRFYAIVEALKEKEVVGYALDDFLETYDSVKWYDHEQDMKEVSKQFPDIIFELHGEGEDTGDIWDKYFKNGKIQVCRAEIVIPPFDESKLE